MRRSLLCRCCAAWPASGCACALSGQSSMPPLGVEPRACGQRVLRQGARGRTGSCSRAQGADALLGRHVHDAARSDRGASGAAPSRRLFIREPIEIPGAERLPQLRVRRAAARRTVRVTQDCSLRAQAGEYVAVNPLRPRTTSSSARTTRASASTTAAYAGVSTAASHWGDQTPPFFQVPLLDRPAGRRLREPDGHLGLAGERVRRRNADEVFDVAGLDNAVVVAKSNACIHGAFFHSPDSGAASRSTARCPSA